jgi:4-amino-4-deoxy-L-arabinose transferase-like glycosyltransferase
MDFSQQDITIGLIFCSCFYAISLYFQFKKGNTRLALASLFIGTLLLRLLFTALDPFLADWDERFHALVSKNLMDYPFKPMLRLNPILPYDTEAWCCNHIWVHKQPLFLWQMALSMKAFGVNVIALRLPSALMATIMVYFVYDIGKSWTKSQVIAFIAAFLYAMNSIFMEIIAGNFALDHNDMAFIFYVTGSIWAFSRYSSLPNYQWAVVIGLFVGGAVLNKWLPGFLVYAGWALSVLLNKADRSNRQCYAHFFTSIIVACIVFVPWQIYTAYAFPAEAAASQKHNMLHIFEDLGHKGTIFYHFDVALKVYKKDGIFFILLGLLGLIGSVEISKKHSVAYLTMAAVLFLFFSVLVKTKMQGFVLPIMSIMFILMAIGLYNALSFINPTTPLKRIGLSLCIIVLAFSQFDPSEVINSRKSSETRDKEIHNTAVFKNLDESTLKDYYIFNAKSYEDNEIMFFKNLNVYQWYPETAQVLDSLSIAGYKIAMFDSPVQPAPDYARNNPNIRIIPVDFK